MCRPLLEKTSVGRSRYRWWAACAGWWVSVACWYWARGDRWWPAPPPPLRCLLLPRAPALERRPRAAAPHRHTVYMAEANLVGGGQQDLEYSLERRTPCPRPQAVEGMGGASSGPEL